MGRISNVFISILNGCTLLVGLAAIVASMYFRFHGGSDCRKFLQNPLLILGLFSFVLSLLGLIGSCRRINAALYAYLAVMFLLILGLIAFLVFAILVTNKGVGKAVSGIGFKEIRLGDYSNWLRNHVVSEKNWNPIKSCLIDAKICRHLNSDGGRRGAAEFVKKNLSPIKSGCCQPPSNCGFEHNGTSWVVPKSGPAAPDVDCRAWSGQVDTLCYNCVSCKVGVLSNITKEWKHFAIFNSCVLALVTLIYSVGCCASRNNRRSRTKYDQCRTYP